MNEEKVTSSKATETQHRRSFQLKGDLDQENPTVSLSPR